MSIPNTAKSDNLVQKPVLTSFDDYKSYSKNNYLNTKKQSQQSQISQKKSLDHLYSPQSREQQVFRSFFNHQKSDPQTATNSSLCNLSNYLNSKQLSTKNQDLSLNYQKNSENQIKTETSTKNKIFDFNFSASKKNAKNQQYKELVNAIQQTQIPNFESSKFSIKRNGVVNCYAANTNQGIVRNYNEDRVSIILNITCPNSRTNEQKPWPKCSFFGIYDGHGGTSAADYLRDNLHQLIIKDQNFPWSPIQAIKNGFEQAENNFINMVQNSQVKEGQVDRSGSCAIIVVVIGQTVYVANVGDSRAILSEKGGNKISSLTRDHKPEDQLENKRIIQAGGRIYQSKVQTFVENTNYQQTILGPFRVLPGRLSVTRTIGDVEAKFAKYGGNNKVIIPTPDISQFDVTDDHDFIIIGSDGIYDKMTTEDVGNSVWATKYISKAQNVHQFCGESVESIMKISIARTSYDNITVVMIGFDNLQKNFNEFIKLQQKPLYSVEQQVKTDNTNSIANPLISKALSQFQYNNKQQLQSEKEQNEIPTKKESSKKKIRQDHSYVEKQPNINNNSDIQPTRKLFSAIAQLRKDENQNNNQNKANYNLSNSLMNHLNISNSSNQPQKNSNNVLKDGKINFGISNSLEFNKDLLNQIKLLSNKSYSNNQILKNFSQKNISVSKQKKKDAQYYKQK